MDSKQRLISSLVETPSTYEIDIIDKSTLPIYMRFKKVLKIIIKPPTLEVLSLCAKPLLRIPNEVRESKEVTIAEAVKYRKEMAEVIAILAYGKPSDYPKWYVPFLLNNLTSSDLYRLFTETAMKMQSDFFLTSFQIANQTNPMMMNSRKETSSTPTNS